MLFKLHLVKPGPSVFPHCADTRNKVSSGYLRQGCNSVQNFLLAYQKFNANSTCFGGTQAPKEGGSGRGEQREFTPHHTHGLTDEQVPGKDSCIAEAWLRTSASRFQRKPVATRQHYAPESRQAAANSWHQLQKNMNFLFKPTQRDKEKSV